MKYFIGCILIFFNSTAFAQELPLQVRKDLYIQALAKSLTAKEFEKSLQQLQKLRGLGVELPPEIDYFEAVANCNTKRFIICETVLKRYILQRGKSGRYYRLALALLAKEEDSFSKAKSERRATMEKQREREARELAEERRRAAFIPVMVTNSCHKPIKFLIQYKDVDGNRKTNGFYKFESKETAKLKKIRVSRKKPFYYHAETYDNKIKWGHKYSKYTIKHGPRKNKCENWTLAPAPSNHCSTMSKRINSLSHSARLQTWLRTAPDCLRCQEWDRSRPEYGAIKVPGSASADATQHNLVIDCETQRLAAQQTSMSQVRGPSSGGSAANAALIYERGREYSRNRKYALAIGEFDRAIAQNPNKSEMYNSRAWAYFKLGKSARGLADADRAVQLDPRNSNALDTLAHILEATGNKNAAIAYYRKALRIKPRLRSSRRGLKRLGVDP